MESYKKLLQNNKIWASQKTEQDPDFFERLVNTQSPKFLWVGCSDSRVPPNEITRTTPGEVFIHRNVANLVVHTDMNFLSVLQYAVEVLKVRHIIVCGHYGCGGVKAAMGNLQHGIIDNWLRNIKDVYRHYEAELDALDEAERFKRLVQLNVQEQAQNLANTNIVQQAWEHGDEPLIHGWVYDLHDGIIDPICEIDRSMPFEHKIYRYEAAPNKLHGK
jgi:carbonic anhydrase